MKNKKYILIGTLWPLSLLVFPLYLLYRANSEETKKSSFERVFFEDLFVKEGEGEVQARITFEALYRDYSKIIVFTNSPLLLEHYVQIPTDGVMTDMKCEAISKILQDSPSLYFSLPTDLMIKQSEEIISLVDFYVFTKDGGEKILKSLTQYIEKTSSHQIKSMAKRLHDAIEKETKNCAGYQYSAIDWTIMDTPFQQIKLNDAQSRMLSHKINFLIQNRKRLDSSIEAKIEIMPTLELIEISKLNSAGNQEFYNLYNINGALFMSNKERQSKFLEITDSDFEEIKHLINHSGVKIPLP